MRYLRDLRCRLQQRRNRVYKTDYRHYETELQIFLFSRQSRMAIIR